MRSISQIDSAGNRYVFILCGIPLHTGTERITDPIAFAVYVQIKAQRTAAAQGLGHINVEINFSLFADLAGEYHLAVRIQGAVAVDNHALYTAASEIGSRRTVFLAAAVIES